MLADLSNLFLIIWMFFKWLKILVKICIELFVVPLSLSKIVDEHVLLGVIGTLLAG